MSFFINIFVLFSRFSLSSVALWPAFCLLLALLTSYDICHELFKPLRQTSWSKGRKCFCILCIHVYVHTYSWTEQRDMNRWQATAIIPLLMSGLPLCLRVCFAYMYVYFVHTYGVSVHVCSVCVCAWVSDGVRTWAAAIGMLLQS